MKYFQKIGTYNVNQLAHSLWRQPELWNQHRFRTTYEGTPHADVDDIWLRFSDTKVCDDGAEAVIDDAECVWHPAAMKLPDAKPIVMDLMKFVGAFELNRLLITRLRPGGRILAHADNVGDYVHDKSRARYHVVIQGLPGSLYHNGDETVCMLTGEVWSFDPHTVHSVENNSADFRIHMLVDVRIWP